MNELSRRSLLHSFLGAPLLWSACSARKGRKTTADMDGGFALQREKLGHHFRDLAALPRPGQWTDLEVAVVGGGVAGLSAMKKLDALGIGNTALYELDNRIGGTAQAGSSSVSDHPWGAHYVTVPRSENHQLISLLQEVGAVERIDSLGNPVMAEQHLCRDPSERLFYRGRWYEGLYPVAGSTASEIAEKQRFEAQIDQFTNFRDSQGRRAFTLPMSKSSDDEFLRTLDAQSMAQWMDANGYQSQRLRWWVEYACRDDYGSTAADTSAWSALFYYASRKIPAKSIEEDENRDGDYKAVVTWPEGNARLVRHLQSGLSGRVFSGHAVVSVENKSDHVELVVLDTREGSPKVFGIRAKHVVMATPQFISARVVRGLSESRLLAHKSVQQSPWMVANLHLKDRPVGAGFPLCWDNVLYQSPSLGYVVATHQRGPERGPTVITYYYPLVDSDPLVGRKRLLQLSWQEWAEVVLSDLERAHPQLRDLVQRIDIARWGHGMVRSSPGRIWGGQREEMGKAHGRIHFAHSDLSGVALFEEAFDRGNLAAAAIAEQKRNEAAPETVPGP